MAISRFGQLVLHTLTWTTNNRAMPFGVSATVFWIYLYGSLLGIAGLVKILDELPRERGVDKIMPVGRLFFAIPIGVFGTEHFTSTATIAALVPRWIPAHTNPTPTA